MRDFKQEMREYGMPEEAIQLAETISEILGKSFTEVVQTRHTELLEAVVAKTDVNLIKYVRHLENTLIQHTPIDDNSLKFIRACYNV